MNRAVSGRVRPRHRHAPRARRQRPHCLGAHPATFVAVIYDGGRKHRQTSTSRYARGLRSGQPTWVRCAHTVNPQGGPDLDLNTITEVVRQPPDPPGAQWQAGDALLAGGTWLFSDQQPNLRRLIDLMPLGWDTLRSVTPGSRSAPCARSATCTHSPRPPIGGPLPLFTTSCEAFLASFKVWNSATVGGNICMSLPAGPMITMTVALEATYTLRAPDGSERIVDAADFVTGNHANILAPGEVLRNIDIPASALRKRHTHRRFTLTQLGRSTIFMIATQDHDANDLLLTITAGTTHPVRLAFDSVPDADDAPAAHRRAARRRSGSTTRTALRTTAVTWRSTSPRRSGPSSPRELGHDLHRERQVLRRAAAVRASACARSSARSAATASRRVATQAIAAPAPCGSTAIRCTAASPPRSAPTAARSPRSRDSAHRRTCIRCSSSSATPPASSAGSAPRG